MHKAMFNYKFSSIQKVLKTKYLPVMLSVLLVNVYSCQQRPSSVENLMVLGFGSDLDIATRKPPWSPIWYQCGPVNVCIGRYLVKYGNIYQSNMAIYTSQIWQYIPAKYGNIYQRASQCLHWKIGQCLHWKIFSQIWLFHFSGSFNAYIDKCVKQHQLAKEELNSCLKEWK